MDKAQIAQKLVTRHKNFIATLSSLSDEDFQRRPREKWTAGQQLEHIIKSAKPVDMAFGPPIFVLKMKFGLSNRPSKTYEKLVGNYLRVLDKNKDYVLPERFAPNEIPFQYKEKKLKKLENLIQKLVSRLKRFTEEDLDPYILPHPVMGKLTLREMLYFTIYHVQHHDKQNIEKLRSWEIKLAHEQDAQIIALLGELPLPKPLVTYFMTNKISLTI